MPLIRSVYSSTISIAALGGHLTKIVQLGLRVLIESGDPHVEGGALHARLPFFDARGAVLVDVVLDELQQHVGHVQALGCGDGLEAVVQLDGYVQVHAFHLWFFLLWRSDSPPLLSQDEAIRF